MANSICDDCGKTKPNRQAKRCRDCYVKNINSSTCEHDDCSRKYFANGMCRWHYNRSLRKTVEQKPCEQCGSNITEVGRRKYCSVACYEIAMRPLRHQWRRDNPDYRKRQSERQRVRRHGVDPENFVPASRCDICGDGQETLAIDHDHDCCPGKYSCGECIRGFLCNSCNNGLGRFKDDPNLLQAAIEYLRRDNVTENRSPNPVCGQSHGVGHLPN